MLLVIKIAKQILYKLSYNSVTSKYTNKTNIRRNKTVYSKLCFYEIYLKWCVADKSFFDG